MLQTTPSRSVIRARLCQLASLSVLTSLCCLVVLSAPSTSHALNLNRLKKTWSKLSFRKKPCVISRVVDGDTAHVLCEGKREKLRLVGIDTPETKHPYKPIEYYGPEASARAKVLLRQGMTVWLAKGPGRMRGFYGRMLVFLFMPNGKMFNMQMVDEGFAFAMRRYPNVYKAAFIQAEAQARKARKGMWANPTRVKQMQEADKAYRRQGKACKRKLRRRRFSWVIGNRQQKLYYTRNGNRRAYFRTDPAQRVLFCSVQDAEAAGYKQAARGAAGYRSYRRSSLPAPGTSQARPPSRAELGTLIIGDPTRKRYRVIPAGRYRIFSSEAAARAAGYKRRRRRRRRRGKRPTAPLKVAVKCKGGQPAIVGNRRSKVYRLPTQRSYRRALRSRNAVFFCKESQALKSGYRRAKR